MAPASNRYRILVLVGLSDVLIGLVLALVGRSQDNPVLTVVGVALALGGAAVATLFTIAGNRPTEL